MPTGVTFENGISITEIKANTFGLLEAERLHAAQNVTEIGDSALNKRLAVINLENIVS